MPDNIVELSHQLDTDVQPYPGEPGFSYVKLLEIHEHGCNVRMMTMTSHIGTHIDAPYHFIPNGKTIEQISLTDLIGSVLVVDLSTQNLLPRQKISWADLQPHVTHLRPGTILLLNTGWSKQHWGTPEYNNHPYLAVDVAENLLERGVKVMGVDTLNPDQTPFEDVKVEDTEFGFHQVFLSADGVICENLTNLEALIGKENLEVCIIPMYLRGSDGSPVRAFARQKA